MILENRGFLTLEDVYVSSIDFYNQVKDKRWPILHAESSHSISYVKRQLLKLVVYCIDSRTHFNFNLRKFD